MTNQEMFDYLKKQNATLDKFLRENNINEGPVSNVWCENLRVIGKLYFELEDDK